MWFTSCYTSCVKKSPGCQSNWHFAVRFLSVFSLFFFPVSRFIPTTHFLFFSMYSKCESFNKPGYHWSYHSYMYKISTESGGIMSLMKNLIQGFGFNFFPDIVPPFTSHTHCLQRWSKQKLTSIKHVRVLNFCVMSYSNLGNEMLL